MAAIIETTRGGRCGICATDFELGEIGYTHIGGERHDGFHRRCYANWLRNHTLCPYNDAQVDPSGLVPRTERIMAYLEPVLKIAAYANGLGFTAAVAAAAIAPPKNNGAQTALTAISAGLVVVTFDEFTERALLAALGAMGCCLAAVEAIERTGQCYPLAGVLLGVRVGLMAKKILNSRGVNSWHRQLITVWMVTEGMLYKVLTVPLPTRVGGDTADRIIDVAARVVCLAAVVVMFAVLVVNAQHQQEP